MNDPKLDELDDWNGAPDSLITGLNAMVEVINALVRMQRNSGTSSEGTNAIEFDVAIGGRPGTVKLLAQGQITV